MVIAVYVYEKAVILEKDTLKFSPTNIFLLQKYIYNDFSICGPYQSG